MRDLRVSGFGHACRGDAEAEEAGIEACEFGFDVRVVQKIGMDEFSEFGVVLAGWSAHDGEDLLYLGVEQTLA